MGFEPTTLRDLVICSNHWATGEWVHMRHDIIWLSDLVMRFQSKTHISPLLAIVSSYIRIDVSTLKISSLKISL